MVRVAAVSTRSVNFLYKFIVLSLGEAVASPFYFTWVLVLTFGQGVVKKLLKFVEIFGLNDILFLNQSGFSKRVICKTQIIN